MGGSVERHPDLYRKIQKEGNQKAKYFPTMEAFKAAFERYLTESHNTYVYKAGENKGKNPVSLWNEGYAQYCEENPEKPLDESLILLCSRATEPKTLYGNGILDRKTNTWYSNNWIVGKLGEKVYLRIPPMDNTKVYCYGKKDNFLGVLYAQERIPKIINYLEERYKLENQMKRVNTVNKAIKGEKRISLKNTEIIPEDAFERISASRKAIAQSKGLDVEEKIIETGVTQMSKFDRDIAESKRQEEFGKTEIPFIEKPKEKEWKWDYEEDNENIKYA
jgi:hypothetical protein